MAKGQCCGCKLELTKGNTGPKILEEGYGYCKDCHASRYSKWRGENRKRLRAINKRNYDKYAETRRGYRRKYYVKNREEVNANLSKHFKSFKGKHAKVTRLLRKEGVFKTDALWSINFYSEIIQDWQCHYCGGALNPFGHGLDRMDNSVGHVCWNVVPCCKSCNQRKWNDLSYEEMMLLAPVLREIRIRRDNNARLPS